MGMFLTVLAYIGVYLLVGTTLALLSLPSIIKNSARRKIGRKYTQINRGEVLSVVFVMIATWPLAFPIRTLSLLVKHQIDRVDHDLDVEKREQQEKDIAEQERELKRLERKLNELNTTAQTQLDNNLVYIMSAKEFSKGGIT